VIILGERVNDTNVLHIIIGQETEKQFDLDGRSVMDISDFIANCKGEECHIVMNRCNFESEVLTGLIEKEKQIKMMNMINGIPNQTNDQTLMPTQPTNQSHLKCPQCLMEDCCDVIDGVIQPCKTCQSINEGLAVIENGEDDEALKRLHEKIKKNKGNE